LPAFQKFPLKSSISSILVMKMATIAPTLRVSNPGGASGAAGNNTKQLPTPRHHRNQLKQEKKNWTVQETDALLKGVERWGKGKWSSSK
jgi:hypothetical protein